MDYGSPRARAEDRQHNHRSLTRSASPSSQTRRDRDRVRDRSRSRRHHYRSSRSPVHSSEYDHEQHRERKHCDHHKRRHLSPVSAAPPVLPYNVRQLSKHDLAQLEPMFAMYLDIQKGLLIEDLSEDEVKGRWKSFMKKWNRGELAEGWYDPATFEKAKNSLKMERDTQNPTTSRASLSLELQGQPNIQSDDVSIAEGEGDDDDDEEAYGPKIPNRDHTLRGFQSGPTMPKLQDLELQREQELLDSQSAQRATRIQLKQEVSSHKTQLRTFEDEVAPRAEPGTHERKMEKRREKAAANREFASGRRGGSPAADAAPEAELMGGGGNDDLEALKKAKEQEMRKKNERERRREEILRAKKAEREERLAEYKKKEDETMGWLKALAKQRFG